MAKLKVVSANCPSCGAALPVTPGASQIQCRYCGNVITVEMRRPPPEVRPFGSPGVMPSRVLYVDPAAMRNASMANSIVGIVIAVVCIVPILIGAGAAGCRSCASKIRPYPIACSYNDRLEISGNWDSSTTPVATKLDNSCHVHIKDAKIKAPSFVVAGSSNVEITLENVTIETTDTMFKLDSNGKIHLINSTLVSQGAVIDSDSNLTLDAVGSTIESKTAVAIITKPNLKMTLTSSKVRGKKAAIDTQSNFELKMKGTELTGETLAVKTTSGFKLTAESSKLGGGLEVTSGLRLDFTDTVLTTATEEAITGDSGLDLVLANSTLQGTVGVLTKSGLKVKATKKSRIIGTTGNGITATSGADISLTEASLEAAAVALKADSSLRVKLGAGSRVAGKRGGIAGESSTNIEGVSTAIEGGAGPGLRTTYGATISVRESVIKGTPGTQVDRSTTADLVGTRVEGGQVVSK